MSLRERLHCLYRRGSVRFRRGDRHIHSETPRTRSDGPSGTDHLQIYYRRRRADPPVIVRRHLLIPSSIAVSVFRQFLARLKPKSFNMRCLGLRCSKFSAFLGTAPGKNAIFQRFSGPLCQISCISWHGSPCITHISSTKHHDVLQR